MKRKIKAAVLYYCIKHIEKYGFTCVRIETIGGKSYIKNSDGTLMRIGRK